MKNVPRSAKPLSLRKNAARWKRELLATLNLKKRDKTRVNRLLNRYKCEDVRNALDEMYGNLCCYCESTIGVVAFEHIEHRKPKAIFPQQTYEWRNLHLACPKCNQTKSNNWDSKAPILDPTAIEKKNCIEEHLTYELKQVLGCIRSAKTTRGRTTIDHANLNRTKLRDARTKVALGVFEVITPINNAPKSPKVTELRLELNEKASGEFGSMVKWLIDTFLRAA